MAQRPKRLGAEKHLEMPTGVVVPAASSGFRFSSPYLCVMSATTLSFGTMVPVALNCSDSSFRELSPVPSGKRALPAYQGLFQKKDGTEAHSSPRHGETRLCHFCSN